MAEPAAFKPWWRSSWLWPAVRLGISVGFLVTLVTHLNARQIGDAMLQVGPVAVALGATFSFVVSVPMALRWQIVIATDTHRLGFVDVWSSTLIGMFFNQVLPQRIAHHRFVINNQNANVLRFVFGHQCV